MDQQTIRVLRQRLAAAVHRGSATRNLMTIFRSEAVTNLAVQHQNPK